jgi:hypothetical protein
VNFLGVSLGDSSSEMGEISADYDKPSQLSLAAFIKSYVAQAELVESVGTEMTYVLPTGESYGSKFENLFDALNQNLERFNISSFGVSDTTLEEVSMKHLEIHLGFFFSTVLPRTGQSKRATDYKFSSRAQWSLNSYFLLGVS